MSHPSHLRKRLLAAAIPLALVAASFGPAAVAQGDDSNSVMTMTRAGGVTPIWHPNARETGVQNIALELIFSNLLDNCWEGAELKLCGDLAESWQTDDGQTFTFNLRDDVVWHDGTPLTAEDVAFTINRSYDNVIRYSNQVWDPIQGATAVKDGSADAATGVEVIDDHTIVLTLETPDASWLNQLPEPYGGIVPKHILESTEGSESESIPFSTTEPVGSGPYKFIRYEPDQFIEFQANSDYFKGAPSIDTIFFRLLGPDVAIAQLEAGELDLAVEVNPAEGPRLAENPALDTISTAGVGNSGLYFNLLNVTDPRTRRAVGHAIDAQGIIDGILGGGGRVNRGLHPGMPADDDAAFIDFDPEVARQLLEESDWDPSQTFRIAFDPGASGVSQWLPIVQQQLQDIGMTVELVPVDTAGYIDFWNNVDEWEAVVTGPGGNQGVGPLNSQPQYQCGLDSPAYFQARQTNCAIDEMFVAARAEADDAARDVIFREISDLLLAEADWVSLWTTNNLSVKSKGLSGVNIPANAREFAVGAERWTLEE